MWLKPSILDRTLPLIEVERLDRELALLGRGSGPIRLRLGEAIEALGRSGGHHELGFSSMDGYALERCKRPGRYVGEARAMARRLEKLPKIREALRAGEILWSMAELLSRRAMPEDEGARLEEAHGRTVRAMRAALSPQGASVEPDDEEVPMRTLTVTVSAADAWALECARTLVGEMGAGKTDEEVSYALLAEGTTTLE